ncbi:hypothetical protein GUITHDRAFT_122823 [Guillardia theta CCMP2712]|uniref:Uncharacterized protein n=1 Tax=Guillardia theta (strain CCMP2712) TaxID=905079 RepID=L1I4G6_GUITC|nr:hypothetical protein GUITHDRAFT_122823 [Guillardia theta CCMP2712]EKX30972.1 hypothetical protein GUITHDRAFT_122823 [Guillardia theta CCMP2712]|eukprot:XP_005817952.1 hypothetical protein GUITHDRAFT_122823 [Guillardia theta CCMP2712]
MFQLSYIYYRKLQDLYLTSEVYNGYAHADDNSYDNNYKISLTDPVPMDNGSYPSLTGITDLFQQVESYIMSGDIQNGYFPPNSGVNRTEKALRSFSMTSQGSGFLTLGSSYFDASLGVLQYTLPNLASSFLNSDLDRILASVLQSDETLEDWTYNGLQYEYSAFQSYSSLADNARGVMRQTKCLNVKFITKEPDVSQNFIDPVVQLCAIDGSCRSVDICPSAPSYDARTGQSCDLLHDSLNDNCTTKYVHLMEYLSGQGIVMQTHCKQDLFVRDLYTNPSLTVQQVSNIDLPTANPAGTICLRTDSTCLQDKGLGGASIDVSAVRSTLGVDVYTFYRPMTDYSGDPNSDTFYGELYQKNSTGWYPAWIDCYNVSGLNKSRLMSWTGWDPARVAAVKDTLLGREHGYGSTPDLSVLGREAVWSDASYRPTGFSYRCGTSSCVGSNGETVQCPGGLCNVAVQGAAVHAVAVALSNSSVYFCASGVAEALVLCPARLTNDSVLVEVRNNLWYCKADCQRAVLLKYIGKHSFRYRTLVEGVLGFTASDRNQIGLSPTSNAANGYSQKDAFRLVHWLVSRQVLGSGKALPGAIYNSFWTPPDGFSSTYMSRHSLYPYTTLTLYDYVNYVSQAATMRSQPLSTCINQPVTINNCDNQHTTSLASCVSALKRASAYTAGPGEAVLVRLTALQLTSPYLMHWADASRPSRDQFVDWLLSPTRCAETLQSEAVC